MCGRDSTGRHTGGTGREGSVQRNRHSVVSTGRLWGRRERVRRKSRPSSLRSASSYGGSDRRVPGSTDPPGAEGRVGWGPRGPFTGVGLRRSLLRKHPGDPKRSRSDRLLDPLRQIIHTHGKIVRTVTGLSVSGFSFPLITGRWSLVRTGRKGLWAGVGRMREVLSRVCTGDTKSIIT